MIQIRLAKSKNYKEEYIKPIIQKNISIAGVCREIGIRPTGGNYKTIHYYINLYNIDISHFTGQGWNVGENYINYKPKLPLEDILIENSTYTSTNSLKKRLLNNNMLVYKCDECDITEWNGKELSLHLDHINGNNRDNRLENLRLLCPNCHSQTTTYCNRNNVNITQEYKKDLYENYKNIIQEKENKINKCCDCNCTISRRAKRCVNCYDLYIIENKDNTINHCECGKKIKKESTYCVDCVKIHKIKHEIPQYDILMLDIKNMNKQLVANKYGVSRPTIQRWLSFYDIENNICKCGKKIKKNSTQCVECYKKERLEKSNRPSYEQLKIDIIEMSYCAVGRKYGVSDNAIRKWLKNYEKDL